MTVIPSSHPHGHTQKEAESLFSFHHEKPKERFLVTTKLVKTGFNFLIWEIALVQECLSTSQGSK